MKDLRKNEFIDLMDINEVIYQEHEFHICADIPNLGTVTYYPKKNSLNIHKGNKWERQNGFQFVKNALKNPSKEKIIKEAEFLFDGTIENYNSKVSQVYRFLFTNSEKQMFIDMMVNFRNLKIK